jgi:hypothetical protein
MRTRLAAAALTAAAILTLAACNDTDDDSAKAPAPPKTPTAVDTASIEASLGIPPKPTGAKRTAYLAAIKAVDPYLVKDPDKAIDHGRNQCSALHGGAANPDHFAAQRFGDDTHPLTDAQGKALNAALRATLCPKA